MSLLLLNFMQKASPGPSTKPPAGCCTKTCRYSLLPSMRVEMVGREISWNGGDTMATGGWFTRGSATTTQLLPSHNRQKVLAKKLQNYQQQWFVLPERSTPVWGISATKRGSNSVGVNSQHISALGRLHCIRFSLLGQAPTASCHSVAAALKSEGFWCMLPAAKSLLIRKWAATAPRRPGTHSC